MVFFTLHEQQHNEKFQKALREFEADVSVHRGPAGDLAIGNEELDEDISRSYQQAGIVADYLR